MLKQEEKVIQLHQEYLEMFNLGTEETKKEVIIRVDLKESVKARLIEMLREYVDIFARSYEDMPGLDTDIVVHKLPLREDCPPIKQKLQRTHP